MILAKYRQVGWVFAVYRGIELACIHAVEPAQLEPLFTLWEEKWHRDGGKDINNPKIPVSFIMANGTLVYGAVPDIKTRPKKVKPPIEDMFAPEGLPRALPAPHGRSCSTRWGSARGRQGPLMWKHAPRDDGRPKTLHNRWKRWSRMGVFATIMTELAAQAQDAEMAMIDATHLKTHRTAPSLAVQKARAGS